MRSVCYLHFYFCSWSFRFWSEFRDCDVYHTIRLTTMFHSAFYTLFDSKLHAIKKTFGKWTEVNELKTVNRRESQLLHYPGTRPIRTYTILPAQRQLQYGRVTTNYVHIHRSGIVATSNVHLGDVPNMYCPTQHLKGVSSLNTAYIDNVPS